MIGQKKYDAALPVLEQVLAQAPLNPWALTAMGLIHRAQKKYDAAESFYRKALAEQPENPEIHSNFGNLLNQLDRMDEAVHHSEKAFSIAPDFDNFINNLSVVYRDACMFEQSREMTYKLLQKKPDNADLHVDAGFVSFYLRDLDKGWDEFEWRLKTKDYSFPKEWNVPPWSGSKKDAKGRLLVIPEQGYGDTILMTRFLPKLKEYFKDVHFKCKPEIAEIFKNLPVEIITRKPPVLSDYSRYVSMMSLPRILEKDWLKWPDMPDLFVSDAAKEKAAWLKDHSKGRLKIGIVWSGSATFKNNHKRSVSLERFHDLAAYAPDIQLYSFQKGPNEKDFETHGFGTILPLGNGFKTFSDTAAALQHMDLIIMTDSSVAHLAGALHVPVLNLLNYRPYWLYYPKQNTTPLYPSMRFIHQDTPSNWDKSFEKVKVVLDKLQDNGTAKQQTVLKVIDDVLG